MKIVTEHITLENEHMILTNQRALFWERQKALVLSDVHIGKTAHFRKHGIPIPDDILKKDLERLQLLIERFVPSSIIVVGDLFHAEMNRDLTTFKTWLNQFQDIQFVLVKGNHDRQPNRLIADLNIKVVDSLDLEPFIFLHEPDKKSEQRFTISGHIHPGVLIKGKGKQKLKLPCYQVTSRKLILPAFSLFTGLNTRDIPDEANCYAFTESSIFKF